MSPYYDPMIAKVIAQAPTRAAALDQLAGALDRIVVAGPRTNLSFLGALCRAPGFRQGNFDTGFIDRNLAELGAIKRDIDRAAAALAVLRLLERDAGRIADRRDPEMPASPWDVSDGFQLSGGRQTRFAIVIDGQPAEANVTYANGGRSVAVDGVAPDAGAILIETPQAIHVLRGGRQTIVRLVDFDAADTGHGGGDGVVRAPMHGKVLEVLVEKGDKVTKGQRLAVIEAMKMEHALTAPLDGEVTEIAVAAGSQVAEDAKVMVIAAADNGNTAD